MKEKKYLRIFQFVFCLFFVGCDYSALVESDYKIIFEDKSYDEKKENIDESKGKSEKNDLDKNKVNDADENKNLGDKEGGEKPLGEVKVEASGSDESESKNSEEKENDVIFEIEPDVGEEKQVEKENKDVFGENPINPPEAPEQKERQWNILVYMSADNNLEAAGIEDMLEMELSNLDTDVVSVFVLFDRNSAYDTTNDNWSGTRLYRLETGKESTNRNIISQEIECNRLGLVVGKETELDMSAGYVLENSLSYIRERYPALNYGLIMWGHGTGWRGCGDFCDMNGEIEDQNFGGSFKGFAFDETSKTYMSLKQFGDALDSCLNGNKLDFIGFDTCFGGEIEVMYEIRENADYAVGSEGLINSAGWNYTKLFDRFQKDVEKSSYSFCKNIVESFGEEYKNSIGSSISMVNLSEIKKYVDCFGKYMQSTADLINTAKIRDAILGLMYSNNNCDTDRYTYGTEKNDVYLDIRSMIENLNLYFGNGNSKLRNLYFEFQNAECQAIEDYWSYSKNSGGLGVYFSTLASGSTLSVSHANSYINGKSLYQIDFVKDCKGYVPQNEKETSFLDKLFYKKFD